MAQDLKYDFLADAFTQFETVETPKVEINLPLMDKPLDISDWATRVTDTGTPIIKPQNDRWIVNNPAQQEVTYVDYDIPTKGNLVDNAKYAYSYLVNKGIPKASAAGIVGNLWNENLKNPTQTVKDKYNTTAYGIACFNSKGDLPNLLKWAKDNGIQGNPNFQQQLDYLVYCINTRPALQQLLTGNLSTKQASFVWGKEFERFAGSNRQGYLNINDPEHIKRAKVADSIFKKY